MSGDYSRFQISDDGMSYLLEKRYNGIEHVQRGNIEGLYPSTIRAFDLAPENIKTTEIGPDEYMNITMNDGTEVRYQNTSVDPPSKDQLN